MSSYIIFNRYKSSLYIFILCFFLGFYFGFHYWQIKIFNNCSSTTIIDPIKKSSNKFYNHFQYRTISTCQNEKTNIFLTIAILSSFERLIYYLPSIFETWLLTTTINIEIILFLEEKSFIYTDEYIEKFFFNLNQNIQSCFFIVKLKYVENDYPPQKKSFYAMKFLYTYYSHRTSWILRLDDNAYVNIESLIKWLNSIDHHQALYIGQGGTGRRNGSAIYFPSGKYFCMGGSGVILSQETLIQLGPWLDQCFKFERLTQHEDVELGRCILKHVHIGCTNAYDSKILFYHHYGPGYLFGYDFTPTIISKALILHPINSRNTFRQIFSYYQRKKFSLSKLILSNKINYVTFLNSMEFDLVRDIHYQLIDIRWKIYIETTIQTYIDYLQKFWHQHSKNWIIINGQFLLGYHRFIPKYGLELIVEILLNVRSISITPTQSIIVRKRLHIQQPFINKNYFDYREINNIDINKDDNKLNLIVVANNRDESLERFIKNFQQEIFNDYEQKKLFTLTILYFFHKNSTIIDYIHNLSVRYSSIIRLIILNETEHVYNRGLGRQLASKYFTNTQLLFFLDVDLQFTKQSLINTRRLILHQLSIFSCAIYFPIIYSSFSNMFHHHNNQTIINIQKNSGLFSIYGFGNVAVRKNDLERLGGWEINNYDWGNEDVNLFSKFVNISSNCSIFRSVEPGLKHYYHKKLCHEIQTKTRQKMCYDAEANLLGSQADMINYIFNNKIL